MELNKNKIIFLSVGVIILLSIIFLLLTLNKGASKTETSSENNFTIWMLGKNNSSSSDIIEGFKQLYPTHKSKNIVIEVFPDYEDYILSLTSAFSSGRGPDVFVLNNNESNSIFSNQVVGIDPRVINPNDFRKKYKAFLSDDLIVRLDDSEFLKGIPVGYETLGIYYNRAQVRHSDLDNLSSLNNVIADLRNRNRGVVPLGIGNGTTVDYVSDILTQFFMLESGVTSLRNVTGNVLKQAMASYLLYGDINGFNGYDSRFIELQNLSETALYLFSRGEIHMIVGYPSMINKIKEYGYSASFLQARVFPHYFSGDGKTLVNYDYFVINKDSFNRNMSLDFLSYLSSDTGANSFLSVYTHYLPGLISLESDKLEQRIHKDFNIILKDFYKDEKSLSSFDKGIKLIYDSGIPGILDNSQYAEAKFGNFRDSILCKTNKVINFEGLSLSCNK